MIPIAFNSALSPAVQRPLAGPGPDTGDARGAAQQIIAQTFLGTLLRISRESPLQARYGLGGRGEEVFQSELNRVLIDSAAGRLGGKLADSIAAAMHRHRT